MLIAYYPVLLVVLLYQHTDVVDKVCQSVYSQLLCSFLHNVNELHQTGGQLPLSLMGNLERSLLSKLVQVFGVVT